MNIQHLQSVVIAFRDERDWKKFHNPKDIATAIAVEAAELQEPFLWQSTEASLALSKTQEVAEEVADILNSVLLFCDAAEIDLEKTNSGKRDWKALLDPKDIAIAITVEAAKLQEKFLWQSQEASYALSRVSEVAEKVVELFNGICTFCNIADIDIERVFLDKMEKNRGKYTVEKSRWRSDKYTRL